MPKNVTLYPNKTINLFFSPIPENIYITVNARVKTRITICYILPRKSQTGNF